MVAPGCSHAGLIPSLPLAGRIAATVQYGGNLVVAEANCHTTNNLQRFHGGCGVRCGTRPVHRKLCVHAPLPMKHQLKRLLILISANNDLFYCRTEDHFLECRGTMTVLPNLRKRSPEVAPVSWTPDDLCSRSPRWPRQDEPTHLSSVARWSIWCAPAARRRSWRASLNRRRSRSGTGLASLRVTRGAAMAA